MTDTDYEPRSTPLLLAELPQQKYNIGDTVYRVTINRTTVKLPCPDCYDTHKWTATSPAGTVHEVACPRCSGGFLQTELPALTIQRAASTIDEHRVLNIEARTARHYDFDDHFHYQIQQNGGYHLERSLYPTREAAERVAHDLVAIENAKLDASPAVLASRSFSALNIKEAAGAALRSQVYDAWSAFRNLRTKIDDAIGDVGDDKDVSLTTKDELVENLRDAINTYERYADTRFLDYAPHPIDVLLEVVGNVLESIPAPAYYSTLLDARDAVLALLPPAAEAPDA